MPSASVHALRSLLEKAGCNCTQSAAITCKPFFGGAAAFTEGNIFVTLTSVGLALKLPSESRAILIAQGARALRYFPNGPIKKDYVLIPAGMADKPKVLAPWIVKSILFARAGLHLDGRDTASG